MIVATDPFGGLGFMRTPERNPTGAFLVGSLAWRQPSLAPAQNCASDVLSQGSIHTRLERSLQWERVFGGAGALEWFFRFNYCGLSSEQLLKSAGLVVRHR
jgi:hypothetical protein